MNDRPRPSHIALGLLAAGVLAPRVASAQFVERLSLHAEVGAGAMLTGSVRDTFGLGWGDEGSIRGAIEIVGPLSVQLSGIFWNFPSNVNATAGGMWSGPTFIGAGMAGLRLDPLIGDYVRIGLEGNFGFSVTGPDNNVRPAWDAALSFEFRLWDGFYMGPVARIGQLLAGSNDLLGASPFYLIGGLSLGFHPRHVEPPPPDTDHDGVIDPDDLCPTVPAGDHPDPHRRGCPLEDRDHDGVYDPDDLCPDVPAGDHPDPARRGCPIADRDHDGVLDDVDQCPDVPAGDHPDPHRAGCPDGDRDHDGVLDSADQCPDVPAGEHPDPARPGCPIADRDHDTVPDNVDHCPDVPGAPSTDPMRNGCPGLVLIEGGQVRINRPVFFATDRDVILRTSFPVLEAVADAIRATPAIHRVSVEGHTDNVGLEAHNMDLSQRRAESVMHWLTEHQVEAGRLEAHGYGPSRPVQPNTTSAGRAANRRVEFHITDPAPPAGSVAPPLPAPVPEAHPAVSHPHAEHHHSEHPAATH